ncbi:uncharacterized protein LOC119835965 [Zerene cesonia]|uniref:uncharacterized protein LOC119835965 n=1 Tax=Zerene cesonia TaxID=33412 RepID=UPI0018E582EA|nr:uncharacterized protein LOC119835965 [Zerene cesonia]
METTVRAYNRVLRMAGISIFCKKNWKSKKWLTFQILTLVSMFMAIAFSTAFTLSCLPDLHLSIESAVVASTFYITFLTLYLYLGNKRKFEVFLTEMVFIDPALENPFIKYVLDSRSMGDKMKEFKSFIISSQERLLRLSRFFLQMYVFCVAFVVTLYMFAPMYTSNQELTLDLLKYGVHLTLLMVGICIFSYQGQMIDDACAELEAAVMEKWYIFNQQHQKNLLIFHVALSQRMPLYIYGSVTLTFETFTWFVKTGMSFFTLMMSVLEK